LFVESNGKWGLHRHLPSRKLLANNKRLLGGCHVRGVRPPPAKRPISTFGAGMSLSYAMLLDGGSLRDDPLN
jgi:hypothetical protein